MGNQVVFPFICSKGNQLPISSEFHKWCMESTLKPIVLKAILDPKKTERLPVIYLEFNSTELLYFLTLRGGTCWWTSKSDIHNFKVAKRSIIDNLTCIVSDDIPCYVKMIYDIGVKMLLSTWKRSAESKQILDNDIWIGYAISTFNFFIWTTLVMDGPCILLK